MRKFEPKFPFEGETPQKRKSKARNENVSRKF